MQSSIVSTLYPQEEVIARRIDSLDVRLARLQELEQRVASLEKFCGCETEKGDAKDAKDANDGVFGQNDPTCKARSSQDGGSQWSSVVGA